MDGFYYFSCEDMINGGIAFYHNTSGSDEPDQSERLDITEDEFNEILDIHGLKLDWVYLKDYDLYVNEHGDTDQISVTVTGG